MGKFVINKGKSGYMFNLKAGNNEIIATSQSYQSLDSCRGGVESVRKNAAKANLEDQTVEGFEPQSHPKFEVYRDKAGEFRFRLKAHNGEIIVTGEGYTTKQKCLQGIESIRKNAPDADVILKEEK